MKIELYNDNFQNYKAYNLPTKAQLVIADIPYNLGSDAYASNKNWWFGADIKNGASDKAGKAFFNTDERFNIAEFFHFSAKMLKPDWNSSVTDWHFRSTTCRSCWIWTVC